MAITWELEQHFEQYRDYELEIPDVNEHGGRIRLTINTEEHKAYISLVLDNEDEEIFVEGVSVDVPLPWALAVAQGTDGFILPTKKRLQTAIKESDCKFDCGGYQEAIC